jgi:hypothetical protein
MLINFLKSISYPKKSQVTVYIFTVMAALVLTAFVVVEVGKTAKDKTFTDNSVDAGALATASVMATGFNYIAEKNGTHQSDHNKKESDKELGDDGDGKGEIPKTLKDVMEKVQTELEEKVEEAKNAEFCDPSIPPAEKAIERAQTEIANCKELLEDLKAYDEKQREDMKNQADNLYGESGNKKNYYDTSISQGYKIAFQNAGVSHRLGKLGQKMYSAFLQSLEPGSVQSGEPKTFFWVDGSGRPHMVTVIVQTEEVKNWTVITAKDDVQTTTKKVNDAIKGYEDAIKHFENAIEYYSFCPWDWPCWIIWTCWGKGICEVKGWGDEEMDLGKTDSKEQGQKNWESAIKGLNDNKPIERGQSSDLDPESPKYIKDIHHSRTVSAMSFQFHMGSPIKSVYGDIDTMTFYPPVQSSSVSTFNYDGSGKIDGKSASSSHSSGLICAY